MVFAPVQVFQRPDLLFSESTMLNFPLKVMRAVSRNEIAYPRVDRDAKGIKSHSPRRPGFPRESPPPGSSAWRGTIRHTESGTDRATRRRRFLVQWIPSFLHVAFDRSHGIAN